MIPTGNIPNKTRSEGTEDVFNIGANSENSKNAKSPMRKKKIVRKESKNKKNEEAN